jgi:hypothetical protein
MDRPNLAHQLVVDQGILLLGTCSRSSHCSSGGERQSGNEWERMEKKLTRAYFFILAPWDVRKWHLAVHLMPHIKGRWAVILAMLPVYCVVNSYSVCGTITMTMIISLCLETCVGPLRGVVTSTRHVCAFCGELSYLLLTSRQNGKILNDVIMAIF